MKIQIMSDLHLEFRGEQQRLKGVLPDADVLVIAGDAADYHTLPRFYLMALEVAKTGKKIVYVPGNHEFYRAPNVATALECFEHIPLGLFNNGVRGGYRSAFDISLDGVDEPPTRFITATLWSDLSNPIDESIARGMLSDFRVPGLTPEWYVNEHRSHTRFIAEELEISRVLGRKTVVVTHHAPSRKSIAPRFKGNALNPCFATELSEQFMYSSSAPVLWIHGHTHDSFDYTLGETRVVCNPKGYPNEDKVKESGYHPGLIIEI